MVDLRTLLRLSRPFVSLEADAEQAGCALACSYSSADEYEAATIAARREAGIYGSPSWRLPLVVGSMVSAALVATVLLFI
jgi:hypothetical protein